MRQLSFKKFQIRPFSKGIFCPEHDNTTSFLCQCVKAVTQSKVKFVSPPLPMCDCSVRVGVCEACKYSSTVRESKRLFWCGLAKAYHLEWPDNIFCHVRKVLINKFQMKAFGSRKISSVWQKKLCQLNIWQLFAFGLVFTFILDAETKNSTI